MSYALASLLIALHSAAFSAVDIAAVLNSFAIPSQDGLWTVILVSAAMPTTLAIASTPSYFSNLPNSVAFYQYIIDNAIKNHIRNSKESK